MMFWSDIKDGVYLIAFVSVTVLTRSHRYTCPGDGESIFPGYSNPLRSSSLSVLTIVLR
jgi:hypothetical protein